MSDKDKRSSDEPQNNYNQSEIIRNLPPGSLRGIVGAPNIHASSDQIISVDRHPISPSSKLSEQDLQPETIFRYREVALEAIEHNKEIYFKSVRRERFWEIGKRALAIAPVLAATAFTKTVNPENYGAKGWLLAGAIYGAFAGYAIGDVQKHKNTSKAIESAQTASFQYQQLDIIQPQWVKEGIDKGQQFS